MEIVEAIRTRRSVRKYKGDPIPEQIIRELLELAVWAPSGINTQTWAFVVLEDREYMKNLSGRAKTFLLERLKMMPQLEKYRGMLSDPDMDIFYGAPVLVMIYSSRASGTYLNDCSMAALNLMLAAWDRGIGICWIGFARGAGNTPEVKKELGVPEEYELVAPVILGYPAEPAAPVKREPPHILNWRK
jgi:nitroreductase